MGQADAPSTSGPRVRCPRCGCLLSQLLDGSNQRHLHRNRANEAAARRLRIANAMMVLGEDGRHGGVGLIYALWTTPARHAGIRTQSRSSASKEYRPDNLPALGYLPFDSKIVAAVQVADLAEEKSRPGTTARAARGSRSIGCYNASSCGRICRPRPSITSPPACICRKTNFQEWCWWCKLRRPYSISALRQKHSEAAPEKFHDRPLFRFNILPLGEDLLRGVRMSALGVHAASRCGGACPPRPHPPATAGRHRRLAGRGEIATIRQELPKRSVAWLVGDIGELAAKATWLKLTPVPERVSGIPDQGENGCRWGRSPDT